MSTQDIGLDKAFSVLAFTVNRHIVDHWRRVSLDLGMDFESAYIWGILAHTNVMCHFPPGLNGDNLIRSAGSFEGHAKPVRLTDLADITKLPTETVRRRLKKLEQQGKVMQTRDKSWQILSTGVDQHTIDFTKETIRRFLVTAKEIERILETVDL